MQFELAAFFLFLYLIRNTNPGEKNRAMYDSLCCVLWQRLYPHKASLRPGIYMVPGKKLDKHHGMQLARFSLNIVPCLSYF